MTIEFQIKTPRLILRHWKDSDYEPFAKLNCDPEVLRYFPRLITTEQSNEIIDRCKIEIERDGIGLWAVSVPGICDFIGFIGIRKVGPEMPFAPAVEIGWRLAKEYWGQGYATEGAQAVLDYAFNRMGLDEVVAFTTVTNLPSQNVMKKLGMVYSKDEDFDHPKLDKNHPLARHVLYRIRKCD